MQIARPRRIFAGARNEMTADALALVYDANTNLGKRAVIDAIAATLKAIGDPLEKIWMEDASARRRTYEFQETRAIPGDQAGFRYLWAIPQSERRNNKSRWLTAAMIDNIAVDCSVLFFALPRGLAQEFMPHLTLLRLLAEANITPQYGCGYTCRYDKPDCFAFDYAYNSRVRVIDHAKWVRLCALNNDRVANPAEQQNRQRQARRLLLDVFPLNVLSETHLRQKIGDSSFKDWIVENTGSRSLTQIGPQCFAWLVPASRTASVSAQLKKFGLTIRDRSEPTALPTERISPPATRATPPSRSLPLDQRREPAPPLRSTPQRSALSVSLPTARVGAALCNPAPTRPQNQTAPTADPAIPPRLEEAPAAFERASLLSPARRSDS